MRPILSSGTAPCSPSEQSSSRSPARITVFADLGAPRKRLMPIERLRMFRVTARRASCSVNSPRRTCSLAQCDRGSAAAAVRGGSGSSANRRHGRWSRDHSATRRLPGWWRWPRDRPHRRECSRPESRAPAGVVDSLPRAPCALGQHGFHRQLRGDLAAVLAADAIGQGKDPSAIATCFRS